MKKILLIVGLLAIFSNVIFAKPIDESTAKTVGKTFLAIRTQSQNFTVNSELNLIYHPSFTTTTTATLSESASFFYVFNGENGGFVIVSGDDQVMPILGYSNEGSFDPNNIPPNARKWLEDYKKQIREVVEKAIPATESIATEWAELMKGNASANKKAGSVDPLMTTKWNQSPYYNAMCPGGSVTGCVATAMAQIMKYWNYPATGSGFHSYKHSTYGTLSANFGSTTYNWSSMPNSLTGSNSAIATLMFHCGVSVDMNYSPKSSGAYVIASSYHPEDCSEFAFKEYFGYENSLKGVRRSDYSESQWVKMLKDELEANRPVMYAGFGSGGGHAFVCDGYDNNSFFHFNWGWGGAYNGFFSINALNPSGTGTGGGTGGYNSNHQAIIGIQPPSGSETYDMKLYNYVRLSKSTIGYGNSFSVSSNVLNNSATTFNGDYCAAVFDLEGNFIDYVEILTGFSLKSGYVYKDDLVFSNDGLFSILPGSYTVGIFYKPTGGNWLQVASSGSYINSAKLEVINENDIELYSDITVSPGTTVTVGKSMSVNLNILNDGFSTFKGQFSVDLYNLDGSFAQTIEEIDEDGLPAGYTYKSPYLTFSTSAVDVEPGTYLLAVQHNPNNSGWELTGSSYYQNPIKITVKSLDVSVDGYENNDNFNKSYSLPVSFAGNSAKVKTPGSTIHVDTDNDFYKIDLAGGFDYSINARIHDIYDATDGNKYTADVLFSYSTDGITWSDSYDDLMTEAIKMKDGGIIYFHVAPYFEGETGTYLLDVSLQRTPTTAIAETTNSDWMDVFPNPASDLVTVNLNGITGNASGIELLNMQGQVLSVHQVNTSGSVVIPLSNYAKGVYYIRVNSDNGFSTKKLIIGK